MTWNKGLQCPFSIMHKAKYLALIEPAITLVDRKGQDYNNNSVALEDYFPFGDYSYQQMMHMKLLRMRSTLGNPSPNYDSLMDSVLDLLNYTVFYLDYLNQKDKI